MRCVDSADNARVDYAVEHVRFLSEITDDAADVLIAFDICAVGNFKCRYVCIFLLVFKIYQRLFEHTADETAHVVRAINTFDVLCRRGLEGDDIGVRAVSYCIEKKRIVCRVAVDNADCAENSADVICCVDFALTHKNEVVTEYGTAHIGSACAGRHVADNTAHKITVFVIFAEIDAVREGAESLVFFVEYRTCNVCAFAENADHTAEE